MDSTTFYTLYRQTSIGLSLADAIDYLITAKKIDAKLANSVMVNFDKAMAHHLSETVKTNLTMKGKIDTYRYCDEVWTFVLEDVQVRFTSSRTLVEEMNVPGKVRVVACNSQKIAPPEL